MNKQLTSIAVTAALMVSASGFAWNDSGTSEIGSFASPEAMSFEDEMRDLRRILIREMAARAGQRAVVQTLEQEMTDLRRLSRVEKMSDVRGQATTLTLEQEMRDLRAEYRMSQ